MLETESGHGRFVGVSAMPSSQTIYGIVVTLSLNRVVTDREWPRPFRHRSPHRPRPDDERPPAGELLRRLDQCLQKQTRSLRPLHLAGRRRRRLRRLRLRLRPGPGRRTTRRAMISRCHGRFRNRSPQASRISSTGSGTTGSKPAKTKARRSSVTPKPAAKILADAKAKAETSLAEARAQIASEKEAAEEALKLAARDTIKELGSESLRALRAPRDPPRLRRTRRPGIPPPPHPRPRHPRRPRRLRDRPSISSSREVSPANRPRPTSDAGRRGTDPGIHPRNLERNPCAKASRSRSSRNVDSGVSVRIVGRRTSHRPQREDDLANSSSATCFRDTGASFRVSIPWIPELPLMFRRPQSYYTLVASLPALPPHPAGRTAPDQRTPARGTPPHAHPEDAAIVANVR